MILAPIRVKPPGGSALSVGDAQPQYRAAVASRIFSVRGWSCSPRRARSIACWLKPVAPIVACIPWVPCTLFFQPAQLSGASMSMAGRGKMPLAGLLRTAKSIPTRLFHSLHGGLRLPALDLCGCSRCRAARWLLCNPLQSFREFPIRAVFPIL